MALLNKEDVLRQIAEEILNCKKCPLWQHRNKAVPGEGNANAEIMFIGEAPGYHEDIQGRPFVGAAGKLLTQLITSLGLKREDVYITNVVKCRPPNNRDPRPDEIAACSPYLDKQMKVISPRIIVTLGRHSTLYLFSKAGIDISGISQVRGRLFNLTLNDFNVIVIPTYHPAAALYNPRLRDALERDFKFIKKVLTGEYWEEKKKTVTLEEFF